jgi:hypothetical protein
MNFQKKAPVDPIRHIFDLETLDTANTAVVLSLGIVPFRITGNNTFIELVNQGINILFDTDIQKEKGCTVSEETLAWWSGQGASAQTVLTGGNREDPHDLHEIILNSLGQTVPKTRWYARGLHFDMAIINNLCNKFELRQPWGYQDGRDLRTWFDFYKAKESALWRETPEGFIKHNSLHDSALEALHMQQCYQQQLQEDAA